MTTATPEKIRVVAFREDDAWVAQCLEYDIATQAPDLDTLIRRMKAVLSGEAEYTLENHGAVFAGISPAPAYFTAMFESVENTFHTPEGDLMSDAELRIAA